ncbi:hypothetical protein BKA70DRAFT_42850 [Coprinopsis sp. MPI-PUGE-AT-0042]|nr:hypothetical protein BKA70DRAFT_42850 [Coprinopsis sp. MPI-PUGE-AT-0042]
MDWNLALAHSGKFSASEESDADVRLFGMNTGEHPWNSGGHIEFDLTYFDRAKDVLQALGYDYKTVTAQALDELDEIIECMTCTSYDKGRHMLDWRGAILHMYGTGHTYVKVDAKTASEVRVRMREAAIRSRASTYNDPFICTQCMFVGNGSAMRAHLAQKHSITSATNADIALRPHATTLLRSLQYWDFGATLF